MVMRTLSKNQILALKLYRKGLKKTEICRKTGKGRSSVDTAISTGLRNIQRAICIIQLAVDNDILVTDEMETLKGILSKI